MSSPVFLLDSDICISLLAGRLPHGRPRVEACAPGQIVTSAIVFAEVMIGIEKLASSQEADAFFALVPVLSFDDAAARSYAGLPFRRGSFDRLIAAHALALDLTLVTGNSQDFADVPGLRLEDWTRPA